MSSRITLWLDAGWFRFIRRPFRQLLQVCQEDGIQPSARERVGVEGMIEFASTSL